MFHSKDGCKYEKNMMLLLLRTKRLSSSFLLLVLAAAAAGTKKLSGSSYDITSTAHAFHCTGI